jgi:hypothetical protein
VIKFEKCFVLVQPDNNGEEIQIEDEEPLEEEMNRKRKHLSSDAKDIVKNVYQSLLEKDCSAPIKVTSDLVKLPYSTVQDIIADKEKKNAFLQEIFKNFRRTRNRN